MELARCGSAKRIKLEDDTEYILGRRSRDDKQKKVSRSQIQLKINSSDQCTIIKNLGINNIKVQRNLLRYREKVTVCGNFEFELPNNIKYNISGSKESKNMTDDLMNLNVFDNLKREIEVKGGLDTGWNELDMGKLLVLSCKKSLLVEDKCKIAAFDMDGTLIKTKSGKRFPVDEKDWMFYSDRVPCKLKKLVEEDFRLVIFTNQAGLTMGGTNKQKLKTKIEALCEALNVPLQLYIATGHSFYRKPCPGMWMSYLIINKCKVDYNNSIFVGDAAGRPRDWRKGKKKDFSDADRLFASNVKLKFATPEEYFEGCKSFPFIEPAFDPNKLVIKLHFNYNVPPPKRELILMVGSPGSGKSHFVSNHLLTAGYISISRDLLNSWQNCIKATEKYLGLNNNVVIDNTNPDKASREKYISTAKKYSATIRCFVMETTIEMCKHNNKFRSLTDKSHALITDIIINEFWKKHEPPTLDEGFDDIITVPFVPIFKNNAEAALFKMHLN